MPKSERRAPKLARPVAGRHTAQRGGGMRIVHRFGETSEECVPGESWDTTGHCARHARHHYCETCQGWYGVRHEGIHPAHPTWESIRIGCACRPCQDATLLSEVAE